jgi:hypothetical protein
MKGGKMFKREYYMSEWGLFAQHGFIINLLFGTLLV